MPYYKGEDAIIPLLTGSLNKQEPFPSELKKGDAGTKSCTESEIFEQAQTLLKFISKRYDPKLERFALSEVNDTIDDFVRSRRLIIIGAGSSYHSAIGARQILEELTEVPVFLELASDFLDREVPVFRDDVCIFLSQSGITSSVVSACQYCKERDAFLVSITNDTDSCLAKMTNVVVDIMAGSELGTTSTKTYTHQLFTLIVLALQMAADKKHKLDRVLDITREIKELPSKLEHVFKQREHIQHIARTISRKTSLLVMGRGYHQSTCLEGSLKFKEITNMHCEGIHSGELKHGPLALIDSNMPIIMIVMRDGIYDKCMNAVQQVKARSGQPIIICQEDDAVTAEWSDNVIFVPATIDCLSSVLTTAVMQMMSLFVAQMQHKNIDHPRYLQKAVVEDGLYA